jgi:ureidoglycolate lyase
MGHERDAHKTLRVQHLRIVEASSESLAGYGVFIGTTPQDPALPIPFYGGQVIEGQCLPFSSDASVVVRTARVNRRDPEVVWLERHLHMTQLFVGLGSTPFVVTLGKPTHRDGGALPNLDDVRAFLVPGGHGVLLEAGTWHDFPMAVEEPVTIMTLTSAEIVAALAQTREPAEIDAGDVLKIHVGRRMRTRFVVDL